MTRRDVALAVFAALSGAVAMARATPAPRAQARIAAATEALLARAFGPRSGGRKSLGSGGAARGSAGVRRDQPARVASSVSISATMGVAVSTPARLTSAAAKSRQQVVQVADVGGLLQPHHQAVAAKAEVLVDGVAHQLLRLQEALDLVLAARAARRLRSRRAATDGAEKLLAMRPPRSSAVSARSSRRSARAFSSTSATVRLPSIMISRPRNGTGRLSVRSLQLAQSELGLGVDFGGVHRHGGAIRHRGGHVQVKAMLVPTMPRPARAGAAAAAWPRLASKCSARRALFRPGRSRRRCLVAVSGRLPVRESPPAARPAPIPATTDAQRFDRCLLRANRAARDRDAGRDGADGLRQRRAALPHRPLDPVGRGGVALPDDLADVPRRGPGAALRRAHRHRHAAGALPAPGAAAPRRRSSRCCSASSRSWCGSASRYAMLTWGQTTPVMQIPVGAVYLAMPIGFALLIVHLLLMAAPYVRRSAVPRRRRVRSGRGEAVIAVLFIACIVLLALGVPVAFALGGATLAAILVNGSLPLIALPKYLFSGIDVFALDGRAVLHPRRGADDRRLAVGGAAALRVAVRRPLSRRPRAHQHPDAHVLLRHQRLGAGGRRRAGRDHDPDDAQGRLPRRVRGGADGGGVDPRPDHPAVDQHDHLRARVSGRSTSSG